MKLTDITSADYLTYVGLLTIDQKNQLINQIYMPDSYFNPIQDADDNWIISVEEITQCTNPVFVWVKDLPLIEYKPKEPIDIE
jgi:hypothetical protein